MSSIFDSMPNFQAYRDQQNANSAPPDPTSIYSNRTPFSNPVTYNKPTMPLVPFTGDSGGATDPSQDDRNLLEKALNLRPHQNGFFDTLEFLDRGRNAIANAFKGSLPARLNNPTMNPIQGIGDAIAHPYDNFVKPAVDFWHGLSGQEHTTTEDMLPENIKQQYPGAAASIGFMGDVAMDPMTYMGGALFRGIGKGLGMAGQAAEKVLPQAAKDVIGSAKDTLGHVFVPGYGLPEQYKTLRGDYLNKMGAVTHGAVDTAVNLAKPGGKLMSEADRRLVSEGIENPRVLGAPGYTRAPQDVVDASRLTRKLLQSGAREEQSAGLLSSTRKNYFPHVGTDEVKGLKTATVGVSKNPLLRANDSFTQGRKLDGTISEINADHLMNGGKGPMFEEDFAKAFGTREVSRQRAITTQKFVDDTLNQLGQKVPGTTKSAPEGYALVKPDGQWKFYKVDNHMAVSKNAPTYLLPEKVAKDLESFHKSFITNYSIQKAADIFDKGQSLWKGLVTSPNPAFHIRNAAGNVWNNALGGVVNPLSYTTAAKVQQGGRDLLDIGGKQYTADELKRMATRQGILGVGQFGSDIPGAVGAQLERGLKSPWSKAADVIRHPIESGRVVGNTIENNGKLAHFIDRLVKGDTPEQAAAAANKFLFDYGDLTDIEREVFKRAMPFYTWSRKNIPLQLEMMTKKPGMFTGAKHAYDNATQAQGVDDSNLPDYMKNQMAIPINKREDGTVQYLTPGLPLQDLSRIHENPLENIKEVGQMLTPYASIPGQLLSNQTWFNNAPIEKYPGETKPAPFPINKVLPANALNKQTGDPEAQIPAKLSFLLNSTGAIRNYSQAAGDSSAGKIPFLSSFVKSFDPGKAEMFKNLDQKKQMQNQKQKLRDQAGLRLNPWSQQ